MPWAVPRPCTRPGCPNKRPCPEHDKPRSWAPDTRANSTERGYGGDWPKTRLRVIWRDKVCCFCGETVIGDDNRPTKGATVHHVIPRDDGGSDDPSNLLACHKKCHERHHGRG